MRRDLSVRDVRVLGPNASMGSSCAGEEGRSIARLLGIVYRRMTAMLKDLVSESLGF